MASRGPGELSSPRHASMRDEEYLGYPRSMPATSGTRPPSSYAADIAPVAALMADPARAAMLGALLHGHPLAAGELSQVAGVSPATASAHLAKLLDGGLIAVARQGRHRYYRLAGYPVAAALEALGLISPPCRCAPCGSPARPPRSPTRAPATTTWPAAPGWRCWTPCCAAACSGQKNQNRHFPERAVVTLQRTVSR